METRATPKDLLEQGLHPINNEPVHPESAPTDDRQGTGRRCGNCLFRSRSSGARKCDQPDNTKQWVTLAAWWPGCGQHTWNPNKEVLMRIDEITIGERARKDLGDLSELVASIGGVGLIQPVVVTPEGELIAGQRRLEACRKLGWDEIRVVVAEHLNDAVDRLVAERDENTCRKEMTVSERLAIGARIEEMKRPEAEARQRATRLSGRDESGAPVFGSSPGRGTEDSTPERALSRETKALAATAVGMSRAQYSRATRVNRHAEDPNQPPEVRQAAREALHAMDAGAAVRGAHDRFVQRISALDNASDDTTQDEATTPTELIKAKGSRLPKRAQRTSINSGIATLNGLCQGFATVDTIDPTTTHEEVALWERDLSSALRVLRTLHKKVKDHRNGNH